jgi:hypothetical protein
MVLAPIWSPRVQAASRRSAPYWRAQAQDTDAGPESMLGVGPALEDQIGQQRHARPDAGSVTLDPLDGRADVAPVRAWHVLGHGGVAPACAAAQVARDTLALVEQLDRALGDAHLDRRLRQADLCDQVGRV